MELSQNVLMTKRLFKAFLLEVRNILVKKNAFLHPYSDNPMYLAMNALN